MPTPKKKLPTGPIRIDSPSLTFRSELPVSQPDSQDVSTDNNLVEQKPDSADLESGKQDLKLVEQKQDSKSQDFKKKEQTLESGILDSGLLDSWQDEDSTIDMVQSENKILETRNLDSGLIDSALEEIIVTEEALSQEKTLNRSGKTSVSGEFGILDSGIANSSFLDSSKQESLLEPTEYKKVAMRLSSEAVEKLQNFRASSGIPYEILVDVMVRNWEKLPQRTQASYLQQARQLRVNRLLAGQEKTMKTMKNKYLKT